MLIKPTTQKRALQSWAFNGILALAASLFLFGCAPAAEENGQEESGASTEETESSEEGGEGSENQEASTPMIENVDVNKAAELLESNEDIVVLDVRTPEEFQSERIAGAVNIDYRAADFAEKLAGLDKDKTYMVHCAAGGRSAKSRDIMEKAGFTSIYHMDGGMGAWLKAGKPVEK